MSGYLKHIHSHKSSKIKYSNPKFIIIRNPKSRFLKEDNLGTNKINCNEYDQVQIGQMFWGSQPERSQIF